MQRIKTQYVASFVRGIERIGGFGGKSDILAQNQVYFGDPAHYKTTLKRVREATAQNLLSTAKQWLSDGVYILEVHPFPQYKTISSDVDRKKNCPSRVQRLTSSSRICSVQRCLMD